MTPGIVGLSLSWMRSFRASVITACGYRCAGNAVPTDAMRMAEQTSFGKVGVTCRCLTIEHRYSVLAGGRTKYFWPTINPAQGEATGAYRTKYKSKKGCPVQRFFFVFCKINVISNR